MNCDDAFEAMTDPACDHHAELQWHLDLCPRCRQMREVLAPALDRLISVADDANRSLPEDDYMSSTPEQRENRESSPFLSAEAIRIAERAADNVTRPATAPESVSVGAYRSRGASWVRYIAVALLGATVSLTAMGAFVGRKSPDRPNNSGQCTRLQCNNTDTSNPDTARTLVLSCAACHLDGAVK